jgi:hypothetical protein
MTIEELNLEPVTEQAARLLLQKHPNIQFTSGRRDVPQQAHAMASNIVSLNDRLWIGTTYLAGAKLQQWVDDHPSAVTVDQITAGLQETMNAMPEVELLKISRHLTGRAFDIRPVTQDAEAIKADIRALPGLQKFLEKEGGHIRWHAQFQ